MYSLLALGLISAGYFFDDLDAEILACRHEHMYPGSWSYYQSGVMHGSLAFIEDCFGLPEHQLLDAACLYRQMSHLRPR